MDERQTSQSAEERRQARIAKRKKQLMIERIKFFGILGVILVAIILIIVSCTRSCNKKKAKETESTTEAVTTEATTESKLVFPYSASDWNLILVNENNPLPADFKVPSFQPLKGNQNVDERCYSDLQALMDACRAAFPTENSATITRSYEAGNELQDAYEKKVKELVTLGYTQEQAEAEASTIMPKPGTSEYQTGLAVDILDYSNMNKDDSQGENKVQIWLQEHAWEYGFVQRYPADKASLTGVEFEPWHYRYVGKEPAKDMHENNLCLEELIALLAVQ